MHVAQYEQTKKIREKSSVHILRGELLHKNIQFNSCNNHKIAKKSTQILHNSCSCKSVTMKQKKWWIMAILFFFFQNKYFDYLIEVFFLL